MRAQVRLTQKVLWFQLSKVKEISSMKDGVKTLPKALRTKAVTALTSNFGLVGLVQYARQAKFDLVWQVWIGRFGLVGLH